MGSLPWQAMVFFTLWLQLLGFSDLMASSLMAIFALGTSFGHVIGGFIGAPVYEIGTHMPAAAVPSCNARNTSGLGG